ncbi:MAG: pilus assembly protein [Elusimicrobiaceae bacterium]|nr:pilus assembly protein [Elusimicrobiaceae bacterium]
MIRPFSFFRSHKGQATTEVVLLFPVFVIFILFIIKIFGLLVLSQKMEIASYYAARRFQLQSHETDYYQRTWDNRFLEKDIQEKVESYLGFNNPGMRKFLSLNEFKMDVQRSGTWTKITLTARTKPPRIRFLCNYNKDQVCDRDMKCLKGYAFLCETGGEVTEIKYIGKNERPAPYIRPGEK